MTHTMAIPGLINVIAKDAGVNISRKVEVHEAEELENELEAEEDEAGEAGRKENWKGRSMYLLGGRRGTESVWEGMEKV
jgi:twinfilin